MIDLGQQLRRSFQVAPAALENPLPICRRYSKFRSRRFHKAVPSAPTDSQGAFLSLAGEDVLRPESVNTAPPSAPHPRFPCKVVIAQILRRRFHGDLFQSRLVRRPHCCIAPPLRPAYGHVGPPPHSRIVPSSAAANTRRRNPSTRSNRAWWAQPARGPYLDANEARMSLSLYGRDARAQFG